MIYLDNAATTFPKPKSVIKATHKCISKYCANSGRSSHILAEQTADEIYGTREKIASFLNFDRPENICFTANATYALNIAIKTLITEKCHILISDIEHNSVLRPLFALKETLGIEYSSFSTDGDITKNINESMRSDTAAIITTLTSNVTGKNIPLDLLSSIANAKKIKLIVDASQTIGHRKIDLGMHRVSALCAPGHKGLMGIQGAGFAIFDKDIPNKSFIEGGSGNDSLNMKMPADLPEHFEAGTLASPSIISIGYGIDYIEGIGIEMVEYRLNELTNIFLDRLLQISDLEIFGKECGIISFRAKSRSVRTIDNELQKNDICIRSGLHCAPLTHKKIGTLSTGLIRISLSIFNNVSDADKLYSVLKNIYFI